MSGSEFTNGCSSINLEIYHLCDDYVRLAERAYGAAALRGSPGYEDNMARAAARGRKWRKRGHRALMGDRRFIAAVIRWL